VNWTTAKAWIGSVIRVALGAIWIWAAWVKLTAPRTFLQAVRVYDVTPEWLSKGIAYGLPVLELFLGVLLIAGIFTRVMAAVSSGIIAVFLLGLWQAAARDIRLDCGCFGGGGTTDQTTYILDSLRDLSLIGLGVFLIVWPMTHWSLDWHYATKDAVEVPSAKRLRTEEGRRKYEAALAASAKDARIRTRDAVIGIAVVAVLVTAISISVQAKRAKVSGDTTAVNATLAGGVPVGATDAPVTVEIYEDFQCPACNAFEQSFGETLAADVKAGKVKVKYFPLAFLDAQSDGNRYSSRASNAAICAADISAGTFVKLHSVLFGKNASGKNNQPAESSGGLNDTKLLDLATKAVPSASTSTFTTCVQSEKHKAFVAQLTENASKGGITQTPTVKVNGKEVGSPTKTDVTAAIDAAAKGKKLGTPPTPDPADATPSPSPKASGSPAPAVTPTPGK